jgi:peptidyl-prolyl cis-trans isomerase C
MQFLNKTRTAALTAVCTLALLAGSGFPAYAQDANPAAAPEAPANAAPEAPRDPATVLAKVGDRAITEQQLTIAEQEFGSELAQIPPEQKRGVLIDALVNMELLAQAAREAGWTRGRSSRAASSS